MKSERKNASKVFFAVSVFMAALLICFGSPKMAAANSTANTTILNVVRVDYKDAGSQSFVATASASVTVTLVQAGLTASGAPTGTNGNPVLTCLLPGSYASGSTISALYGLTATANGNDTYNLSIATGATANVSGATTAYSTRTYTGATATGGSPATVSLGSAIVTSVKNADTLYFPGGSLAGFAVNDIVVVDFAGTKKAFLVASVVPGTPASHTNLGDTPQTTQGTTTAEVKAELQLKAYSDQTIVLSGTSTTFGGGGVAPAFTTTAPTLGTPVAEMVLIQIDVTATSTSATLDGTVAYTFTASDTATTPHTSTISCTAGNFKAPQLTITKKARNVTAGRSFAATDTGAPSDVLEYEVTVANTGGLATQVTITDAVPAYTTLVSYTGTYATGGAGSGAATDIFATITDNASTPHTVPVTMSGSDSETQPITPVETGFGKAVPLIVPVTGRYDITFYLGDTSTNILGGSVPNCTNPAFTTSATCVGPDSWLTTYKILYRVKID